MRASFDYCVPSIATSTEYMEVTDEEGKLNHIILMSIPQSMRVHANQADEVYYRVGDKSKKLNFEQRMQLVYATIRQHGDAAGQLNGELNAQLHPLLTRNVVNMFNCSETNPNGAQLVFTTHDTNLLSKKLLRRD